MMDIMKHPTIIADRVFIGSNTNLVAPVKIGKGAYVAAGSTYYKMYLKEPWELPVGSKET